MSKIMFGVVAGVASLVGLLGAGEAEAGVVVRQRTTTVTTTTTTRAYYQSHGVRYGNGGGYYFPGQSHNHWGHRVWDSHYGRYHYWEPNLRIYYFYDSGRGGYYPCP
jgi:hypothetical protein